jgi:ferredoxin
MTSTASRSTGVPGWTCITLKLLDKLREIALAPQDYGHGPEWGTDYDRCIGCHICAEVCPTGYINMGLGDIMFLTCLDYWGHLEK